MTSQGPGLVCRGRELLAVGSARVEVRRVVRRRMEVYILQF